MNRKYTDENKIINPADNYPLFSSCKKDEFNTKPTLTFGEVNATELRQGNLLIFTLNFTDKEEIFKIRSGSKKFLEHVQPHQVFNSLVQIGFPILLALLI